MDRPEYVISALQDHPSRLNKEAIIQAQAEAGNTEFFEGVRLALNPFVTFGVKKVPEKSDEDGAGLDWDSFTLAITGFVNREVTGNTAKAMLKTMMSAATKRQWNDWYRRILIKDLRCGCKRKDCEQGTEKVSQD